LAFETLELPKISIQNQAFCSLISQGKTSGLVIDWGENATSVVPIFDSRILKDESNTILVGGKNLNHFLMELLREKYSFHTSYDREMARFMKEELWYISPHKFDYTKIWLGDSQSYTMPDKTVLSIGVEQQLCPEALFNTSLVDLDDASLQHMVFDSLTKVDSSIRKEIAGQCLLVGGTTQFRGFEQRLINEVSSLSKELGKILEFVEDSSKEAQRHISSWIGASILADLSQTHRDMITEDDYEEQGAKRISRQLNT